MDQTNQDIEAAANRVFQHGVERWTAIRPLAPLIPVSSLKRY